MPEGFLEKPGFLITPKFLRGVSVVGDPTAAPVYPVYYPYNPYPCTSVVYTHCVPTEFLGKPGFPLELSHILDRDVSDSDVALGQGGDTVEGSITCLPPAKPGLFLEQRSSPGRHVSPPKEYVRHRKKEEKITHSAVRLVFALHCSHRLMACLDETRRLGIPTHSRFAQLGNDLASFGSTSNNSLLDDPSVYDNSYEHRTRPGWQPGTPGTLGLRGET
ncbi:hypothetical protein C8F04DRAFT_1183832 [Mycena alexandri]|uniref:Uncharacterized protein n=1 Tax=Mycena alexandri TaxID=1745969 RepID=A0AAD6X264_9AGAR|nr:hypothetical protein C8F04DRAFT_1183832 [Mycena alexandri]